MNPALDTSLGAYQDAFAQLLREDPAQATDAQSIPPHAVLAALARQRGFAVYRNTVMKGCVDALAANYPAVHRLVGEEWFRAAAALYARAQPPAQPALLYYGEGFADFLAGFEPAAGYPYLPAVARLDRLWTEAHAARDSAAATAADMARLSLLPPEELAGSVLSPHPAARWRWFDDLPAYTIWRRSREEAGEEDDIEWLPEGALLTRAHGAVSWRAASRAGCAFLDACAAGHAVAHAAQAALACDARTDLASLIGGLLAAGAFAPLAQAHASTCPSPLSNPPAPEVPA